MDINPDAIAAAQKKKKESGKTNVNFFTADISQLDAGKAAGIHPEMDQLEKRLQEEMSHADRAFVRDLAYGICAQI